MKIHYLKFLIITLSLISDVSVADIPIDIKQDNVAKFIDEMVEDYKFDRQYLRDILSKAKRKHHQTHICTCRAYTELERLS